jgi:O-antigen/teichoic acid export membrane protein
MQPIIPTNKQLVRNSASGVIRSIVIAGSLFIVYPIYINRLGTEIFGVWVMIGVVIGWSQIGSLGVPQAVMKFVAGSAAKGDKQELIEYVSSALTIILCSGILITCILFLIKNMLGNFLRVPLTLRPEMPSFIFFAGLIVCISFLAQSINSILSGIGRMDLANINEITARIISATLSVILIWKGYGIWGLLLGNMANVFIILLLACVLSIWNLKFFPFHLRLIKNDRIRESIFFGGTLTAGSLLGMFIEPFNRFILGQYVSLSAATVFDVASRVLVQVKGVLDASFRPFVPQSSVYSNIGEIEKIREISKFSVRAICCLGVPIFLMLIVWAPEFVNIWLEVEVQKISYAIRVIAFAYIFSLIVAPAYYLFVGIGKQERCFWVYFIYSTLNFGFVFLCLFLGIINLALVVNIFAFSLTLSSLYLMRSSHVEFGERYFVDTKNFAFLSLSLVCISFFRFVGWALNFETMFNMLLAFASFSTYLAICYISNLLPANTIRSYIQYKRIRSSE